MMQTMDLVLIASALLVIGCLVGLVIGIKMLAQPGQRLTKSEALSRLPGLVSEGYTNTEIGEMLGRNERTIRKYRQEIRRSVK